MESYIERYITCIYGACDLGTQTRVHNANYWFCHGTTFKKRKKKKKKTEKNVILVSTTRRSDEIVFVLWPLVTLCEAKENVNNMNFGHYLAWKAKENAKTLL